MAKRSWFCWASCCCCWVKVCMTGVCETWAWTWAAWAAAWACCCWTAICLRIWLLFRPSWSIIFTVCCCGRWLTWICKIPLSYMIYVIRFLYSNPIWSLPEKYLDLRRQFIQCIRWLNSTYLCVYRVRIVLWGQHQDFWLLNSQVKEKPENLSPSHQS